MQEKRRGGAALHPAVRWLIQQHTDFIKVSWTITEDVCFYHHSYSKPFASLIQKWVRKVADSMAITEMWMVVQNLWIYLDSVFSNSEITRQLPQETRKFMNVEKSWVRVMQHVKDTPNVIECCVSDDFLPQMLSHLLEQLEQCKKSLSGYQHFFRLVIYYLLIPTIKK